MTGNSMTGEDLYNLYSEAMAIQGCDADSWEECEEIDRRAWEIVAEQVTLYDR